MHPISKRCGKADNKFAVSVQGLAHVVLAADPRRQRSCLAWSALYVNGSSNSFLANSGRLFCLK